KNRERVGRRFRCKRTIRTLQYNDHGYLTADQFGEQRREPIVSTLCPPVLDRQVLAFDVTGFLQASAESGEVLAVGFDRCEMNKPNHRHLRLLRARRQRPCSRAAECSQQSPPSDGDRHTPLPCEVRKGKDTTPLARCPNSAAPGASGAARRAPASTHRRLRHARACFQELSALPPESGQIADDLVCSAKSTLMQCSKLRRYQRCK